MKISSLRVENVRQFRQPIEIKGLTDGINLFCGPNESGKSTLVRALRAAFLERHNTSTLSDLLPFDEQQAAPEIEVSFEAQQQQWHLKKRFLRRQRCSVQVGVHQFDGQDAEEKLAALLGYSVATRGSSEAKHWGIPGLLWIEQGTGHELSSSVVHAGEYVRDALGEALGDVASSAGDALINKVEALRTECVTANTNRPRAEYAKTLNELEAARTRQQQLDEQLREYQQQLEQLGHLRSQINEDAKKPWVALRERAETARQQLAEVELWISAQRQAEQELEACQQKQRWLQDELMRLEAQQSVLLQEEQAVTRAQQEQATQSKQVERLTEQRANTHAVYQAARVAVQAARTQALRQTKMEEAAQLEQRLASLAQHLAEVRRIQAELQRLRESLQNVAVDERLLPALRKKQDEAQRLRIQQEAVATRIHFTLQAGQALRLEGEHEETLVGDGERLLLAATTLQIAGVGQLCIQPGGGADLAELARQVTRLTDEINDGLAHLAVASLSEAEQRAQQQRELTQQIQQQEALLQRYAPQGVEALLAEQQTAQQRQQQVTASLAELPPSAEEMLGVSAAELAFDAADAQLREVEQQLAEQRTNLALSEQNTQRLQERVEQQRAIVAGAEYQQKIKQLREELTTQSSAEITLNAKVETHRQHVEAVDSDGLRLDVKRLTASAELAEGEARQREITAAVLKERLARWGEQDVEHEQATLALTINGLEQRRLEFERRVAALTQLHGLLSQKRHAFIQQVQAPLKERLSHYLRLLFPQGEMCLNEALAPESLQRSAHEHTQLDALSFGTREQVGLLSRLAYADLLQAAGKPTLIILDDVLTNSDAQRLEQMKRVLFDAAQRHQILLFSCHPEQWRDVGVVARDLSAMKAGL